MQFTKLRLIGFKSFVEPQDFVIESGLTGVVGPNGCGKSNLVEALRWVMGENSYKNMRASEMDDVIFSGTNTRPARTSAEVILYVDNSDHRLPANFNDADELQISRRLERYRGSLYRINGKEVRAKDVQLLFADQSTGARSPSMVGQGRVGELIAAKPQARRALLEEAAGISGLFSRRREAESRLQATEQNLSRVEDVKRELALRIESLKRQARQTKRYKTLSSEIRKYEAASFYIEWLKAKSQLNEVETLLTEATIIVADKARAHLLTEEKKQRLKDLLSKLRDDAVNAQIAHQGRISALNKLEEKSAQNLLRKKELAHQITQFDNDLAHEQLSLNESQTVINELDREEASLREQLKQAEHEADELRGLLDELQKTLSASEEAHNRASEQRARLIGLCQQFRHQTSEIASKEKQLAMRLDTIKGELGSLVAQREQLNRSDDDRAQLVNIDAQYALAQQKATAVMHEVARLRQELNQRRQPYEQVRDHHQRLVGERNTIEKLTAALTKDWLMPALDYVSVKKGYEIALSAAFGDDLMASMDNQAVIYWRLLASDDAAQQLPTGVDCLADFVDAPPELEWRLRHIGVIAQEDASDLQAELKPGQCLVSMSGFLWRWDGLCKRPDAPSLSAQRLVQKNRLTEISLLIEQRAGELDRLQQELDQLTAALTAKSDEEEAFRCSMNKVAAIREEKRGYLAEIDRKLAATDARITALNEAQNQINTERVELAKVKLKIGESLRALPDLGALDDEIDQLSSRCSDQRYRVGEVRLSIERKKQQHANNQHRLKQIASERQNWLSRVNSAQRQLTTLQLRRLEAGKAFSLIDDAPDEIAHQRAALLDQLALSEQETRDKADSAARGEHDHLAAEKIADEALMALAQAREQRARVEERLHALRERVNDIESRIKVAFNQAPSEIADKGGIVSGQPLPDEPAINERLQKLKLERERLGPVNLRAEEEEQELTQRHQLLIAECDDLIVAIKKLRHAIYSLNREGRERLLTAFGEVNRQFQRLFTHLFSGGEAELQLIEAEDPLDAGLEINARPPGKKPQTLSLLSGGEQALTALALIFAVFLTNPAPICVLDEVDAPLDDYNVERYCNLLDEMQTLTPTRFIVVTHNPITMARMHRLFGVTMGEKGVSQLVSVDLYQAEQLLEKPLTV